MKNPLIDVILVDLFVCMNKYDYTVNCIPGTDECESTQMWDRNHLYLLNYRDK